MWEKIRALLTIPEEIKGEFWEDSLHKNRISLLVICIMIFGMEFFNIVRVLFWSKSGLSTLNNRIYFGMYCSLCVGAALCLLLQYLLREKSPRMQWLVQYGSVTFFFLWHIFLNAYDLMGDPTSGTLIFVTALLGLTIFIQMPSLFGALYLALGYALFMALSGPVLDTGTKVNLTIASIVALGIIFTRSHHMVIELTQRREIKQINMQLRVLLQKDPLTGLLNKKACQEKAEACLGMASEIEPIAFFLIDLDNFKAINDTFGHPFGDYVLEQAARKLEAVFPDADGIGRIGGDEFVVITHATDAEALYDRAQQLIRAVSTLNSKKKGMDVCCSMGILRVSRSDLQYEQLYEETDQLLYEAKREGKGRCCLKEFSCL